MATKTNSKIRGQKIYDLIYIENSAEISNTSPETVTTETVAAEPTASAEHASVADSPSAGQKQVERSEAKPAQSRSAKEYRLYIGVDNDMKELLFVYRALYPQEHRKLIKKLRAIVRETLEEAYKRDKRMQAILKLK